MIKTLKRKFIFTAMIAIAVLLLGMVVAQNIFNFLSMNAHTNQVLDELGRIYALTPAAASLPEPFPPDPASNPDLFPESGAESSVNSAEESPGESAGDSAGESAGEIPDSEEPALPPVHFGFFLPQINQNDVMRSAYFTVALDDAGEVVYTDLSHIADVTEEMAQSYAIRLHAQHTEKGWLNPFKYSALEDFWGQEVYIFLYRQGELQNFWRELAISVLAMVICLGAMLLFVILLSNKMIKPIAGNLDRQKEFVTYAGHEIKTPLAIIQANTEALELHNGENKWTINIKDQIKRLSILLTNMLTLSKAEDPSSDLSVEQVDLSDILINYIRMYEEPARQKKLHLLTFIDPDLTIQANKIQISQLFSIIFDNAVKYSKEGHGIDVTTHQTDKLIEVEVGNFCDQLPECESDRLFDRFYRPDVSRYSQVNGNGIGLAAARAIIESYDGRIRCRYEGEDRIVFTLLFKK